jgi:hypothetical protein
MIVNITSEDIWKEFVYWRKAGNDTWAFAYIRRESSPYVWRTLIAGLVKFNHPEVRPGDIVVTPTDQFVWNLRLDELLRI